MEESLLIELLTEELPPKSLRKLSGAFCKGIFEGLKAEGFVAADAVYEQLVTEFATPRRLAVLIKNVADKQSDRIVERKGPAVNSSFNASGQPMPALSGFAKSCGVDIAALEKQSGPKGEYFVFRSQQSGESLEKHLATLVAGVIKKLPVAKLMRWGDGEVEFVRPVHGLIMLHGSKIVPGDVLGLKSDNKTSGHRFLSVGDIVIARPDDYERVLEAQGNVIASFEKRRQLFLSQIKSIEKELAVCVVTPADLADSEGPYERSMEDHMQAVYSMIIARDDLSEEVAALIEYPAVYVGHFSEEFLSVPKECLILSMRQHQKYFPVFGQGAQLQAKFLFVSNQKTDDPENIIHGNERVLRARLSDAKFFFDQDKKSRLADRTEKLASVVYHNKLGTQRERVERIQTLAAAIAGKLAHTEWVCGISDVERAAYLCKADLLTDMVGEFPELQGVMGYYYALHDGEPVPVAEAIKEHYERVPRNPIAICVGLADRLDTLVGIYGIGLIPTGDKDPFGLRRNALSVVRTLAENKLSLNLIQLLEMAEAQFVPGVLAEDTSARVYEFMMERLPPYLREDFAADEIEAVLSLKLTRLDGIVPRLMALQAFRKLPEAESLAAANKRIRNILRQAQSEVGDAIDDSLLVEQSEKNLAQKLHVLEQDVTPLLHGEQYAEALTQLASLRPAVDEFFDKVMVMADDIKVRKNRLALLNKLSELFMHVADLSKLQN